MRLGALTVILAFVCCFPAFAQDVPRAEVFGGYSYLNIDTNGISSRQSANGWEASVSGNFNHWFAVEGSVAGYYKSYSFDLASLGLGTVDVDVHDYSYLFGPRVNFRPVFVHALVGGDHLTGSALGFSASQDSFAAAFGGGVEWKVAPQWAIRGSGDYVLTRHNIFGSALQNFTQNNFRASVGVVYLIGGDRGSRPHVIHGKAQQQTCSDTSEAALLGVTGCSSSYGFTVYSVRTGSPAAALGIVRDDIVTSIDGRPVRNSQEIETAIAASASGTIKIAWMLRGTNLTEREVKIR
jgi:opacity protein-like surface antigen